MENSRWVPLKNTYIRLNVRNHNDLAAFEEHE